MELINKCYDVLFTGVLIALALSVVVTLIYIIRSHLTVDRIIGINLIGTIVVIAIAVACKPQILICDEPTTALDVTIQAQILELMQDLQKKLGMAVILVTHDLGVIAEMCDEVAVMYAGHIVEYGTADEIFYEPSHEYTKGLIGSIPRLDATDHERLGPIEGQPVDLLNPPAGCPFAPRCKSCMKICLREMPPKTELSATHYSHCWLRQLEEFNKGGEQA